MERTPLRHRLLGYGVPVAVACLALAWGQRLDLADFRAPMHYEGDALLILPLVKATIEQGHHWHNDRLGAPGVQELHDFPIVDHFHFALLWLMGRVLPDAVVVFNVYHLLTYPLTVLTAMIVLRSVSVSFLAAGLAGLLYSFQPYHDVRGFGHYFLSAYWTLPLSLWPAVLLVFGERAFKTKRQWALQLALAVMTASAGAYYAFFACVVLAFVAVYTSLREKSWAPGRQAAVIVVVIVAAGVLNHLPAILHQAEWGRNSEPTRRSPEEAETYGLKIPPMLLPTPRHHLKPLADLRAAYDTGSRPLQNENETATLGFIGAVTFLGLMAFALLPKRSPGSPLTAIAMLVVFLTLYGLVGGLGSAFNFLVTAQVRSVNRISIVIAFFVFTATAILLDSILQERTLRTRAAVILALTLFGLFDQTARHWFRKPPPQREPFAVLFHQDAEFWRRVEERIPGGAVYQLPFIPYPENIGLGTLGGYDQARGLLHTRTLRFSHGAMRGREADLWHRRVSRLPLAEQLERMILRGFDGLHLDLRGYDAEAGQKMLSDLVCLCQDAIIIGDDDGRQFFFDLRGNRAALKSKLGEAEYARRAMAEAERVEVLWLDGFVSFEPVGREDDHRWCEPRARMIVVNPGDAPKRVTVEMIVRSSTPTPGELTVAGALPFPSPLAVGTTTEPLKLEWTVPPGRHALTFAFKPSKDHSPSDARNLCYFIAQFRLTESP